MNTKLKIALIRRYSNQGFALPIAVGMGFVMLLIATTLVMRSQDDQVTAKAQKSTAQSLSVTETGVTRIQALLKQVPSLAGRRYDSTAGINEWNTLFTTGPAAACTGLVNPITPVLGGTGTNGWIPVPGFGHFKIVKYTPNSPSTGVGTLEVLGTADQNTTTLQSTNNPKESVSPLSVQIPYTTNSAFSPPGLWAATLGPLTGYGNKTLGQTGQQIDGNVLTLDCDTSNFDPDDNFPPGNPKNWTVSAQPYTQFPSLPALPAHVAARAAVTTLGTGNVTLPDDVSGIAPDPGTTDTYSYLVPSISVDSLTVSSGKKVRLYVQGNIDLRGNAGISSESNSLQIYGSNAAGTNGPAVNYRLNSDTTGSYTTTEIGLRGGASIYAFIFAPAAITGVKGGGSGGGFYGSVWVRNWASAPFGSSANHIVVNVPSTFNWSLLPPSLLSSGGLPGQTIQPITEWHRQEAP